MKIECLCGNLIADTTDFISYKAWFVADQDREDGTGERTMCECEECGRLLVQKRGEASFAAFVRYREFFTQLRRRDVLRDAFLRKDGETVHDWP